QAPELFLLKKYCQANRVLIPDKIMEIRGSAEPAVMAGMDIVMIPGDERNFKITTREDLQRFRNCLI
ncbi:MAG TPA: 2-C-methyl-D-erythritol 4-phosphate cytidylyltransferase, partial [Lachnospiraceae bacterium]|nr:2-C-methyl-D-erythritol 4-phosphate cytidylyltransferase [Lachnospiraceae bacterium]